jgi:glycosyltransferase involved in cell wall biosynthesis
MKTISCLFLTASNPKAARNIYFDKLARSFANDNIKVVVIYDNNYSNSEFNHPNLISKAWPSQRPTNMADFFFLIKLIKKYKPDAIISSFGSVNVCNIVGYFTKIRYRINFLLSTPLIFNDKGFTGLIKKMRKKSIYNLANLYIANSFGVLNELEDYYDISLNPHLILPNLINDDSTEKNKRKKQLVIVGGLNPLKGHEYLLNQFRELLVKEPKLKLLIIGDGIEKIKLKTKYSDLIDSRNVEFTGKIERAKVMKHISESLVHVSASLKEAFGFVNIESMMLSTPIICTKTSGSELILKENFNGEFFSLDEKNSLSESFFRITQNWDKYSNNARKDFLERFSLNKNIESHMKMILKKIDAV